MYPATSAMIVSPHAAATIVMRIVRGDAVQLIADQPAQSPRGCQPERHADADQTITSRITSHTTSPETAPSAMRRPISRVRRDAVYAISP